MNATDDLILNTLKKRYFDIALQEDYPNTPDITTEADRLETEIRKRTATSD